MGGRGAHVVSWCAKQADGGEGCVGPALSDTPVPVEVNREASTHHGYKSRWKDNGSNEPLIDANLSSIRMAITARFTQRSSKSLPASVWSWRAITRLPRMVGWEVAA